MRRRRPLMRAAMVGGGAYYAGKHQREREEENEYRDARLEQLEAQQAPQPAAGGGDDMVEQLTKLGQLREQGVLTDAEFEVQKQKVLQNL